MEILIYSCCIYKSGNMKKSKMRVFARKFVEEFFPVRMRDKISIFARSSGKLQCENRGLNLTRLNKKEKGWQASLAHLHVLSEREIKPVWEICQKICILI